MRDLWVICMTGFIAVCAGAVYADPIIAAIQAHPLAWFMSSQALLLTGIVTGYVQSRG